MSNVIYLGDDDSTINPPTPLYKFLRLTETVAAGKVASCSWSTEIFGTLFKEVDVTDNSNFTCSVIGDVSG